jgi:hypothetical protein
MHNARGMFAKQESRQRVPGWSPQCAEGAERELIVSDPAADRPG